MTDSLFSGVSPSDWLKHGLSENDLSKFQPPNQNLIKKNKTEVHFYSYYKFWDPQENFYYAREHCNFLPNPERSEGTFSKYASLDDEYDGFHYYLSYIKFGIGRATTDSSQEIRNNHISREEAKLLVKRFDGEFPKRYFREIMNYLEISEKEFHQTCNKFRSPHIWKFSKGTWKLRHTVNRDGTDD